MKAAKRDWNEPPTSSKSRFK